MSEEITIPKILVEDKESEKPVLHDADILNPNFDFDDKIIVASRVAESLKAVIDAQGLSVKIKGRDYVTAEGWNTLGTMMGCYAKTEYVKSFPESKARIAYKARVSIMRGNNVLSIAEAISTSGEGRNDEYAIYSMAQTRAMGKAFRMAFSWIMKLAGYETTPEEEMTFLKLNETRKNKKQNKK